MKKLFILLLIAFSLNLLEAQHTGVVAEKIASLQVQKTKFDSFNFFSVDQPATKDNNYRKAASDVTVMKVKSHELERVQKLQPEAIEFSFPFQGEEIPVILCKNKSVISDDFLLLDSKGGKIKFKKGLYYYGIIKGKTNSLVSFSFFENDIVGIASHPKYGNVVLAKVNKSTDFISYAEGKLTRTNPSACASDLFNMKKRSSIGDYASHVSRIVFPGEEPTPPIPPTPTPPVNSNKSVRVYYELDYSIYQNNEYNMQNTSNWITAVHNNVSTLYANEGINTPASNILIWTTPSSYSGSYNERLEQFKNMRPSFNGDMGHLISSPGGTSVAFIDGLCGNRYAYSAVNHEFNNIPIYSWTISVITHEMGHVLGSPHTHACAWNGNNTAIDGCGPEIGANEGCTASLPALGGGTIMSYCHLVGSVGINLSNGFGPQPRDRIRNTINSKYCLSGGGNGGGGGGGIVFPSYYSTNSEGLLEISPNPAKNKVSIRSKEKIKKYSIFGAEGRLYTREVIDTDTLFIDLDISSLPVGNYILSITTENSTVNKKLIKY